MIGKILYTSLFENIYYNFGSSYANMHLWILRDGNFVISKFIITYTYTIITLDNILWIEFQFLLTEVVFETLNILPAVKNFNIVTSKNIQKPSSSICGKSGKR